MIEKVRAESIDSASFFGLKYSKYKNISFEKNIFKSIFIYYFFLAHLQSKSDE